VRAVIPGSQESTEPLAAYSDLGSETSASAVDWYAADFERIAEQTLGGSAPT
jgi:hypothetical protein